MNARTVPAASEPRFPLPRRHRRMLACAAVAASVALGSLGVGATVETVRHQVQVSRAQAPQQLGR
ncbi:hypothetical protein [Streptomyces sp. TLI_171]|uniref:hypothetical protein n=1 Tax=Streptomyces sp. TLI_171 TaxID=1938859 RepID=UPI000C1A399B|nr:hypothetical protein [Streptomyces sp. TLI_171]RKE22568.1 hypothetical protein BX266_6014 [Streptomyces sp. TLI_171]